MNAMNGKTFLDTNLFIYAIDSSPAPGRKPKTARKIIRDCIRNETGVISIQVLQEFYQVTTHKIQIPLPPEQALEYLQYMAVLDIVHPDFDMVVAGIHLQIEYRFSFWDALILQASLTAGCSRILSEDLQHGFRIGGLTVENPFS
jgi:predicted nucleic acid-binding protein